MGKHRNKGNIIIDLTSLLDVIFIVLLVVVCQLQNTKNVNAKETQDIERTKTQLQMEEELYEDQRQQMSEILNYVVFISVNAQYESDLKTRHIEVMCSDDQSTVPEIAELKGNNVTEGYEDLRNYLIEYISDNPEAIIILTLNEGNDEILYRDEKAIKNIFSDICSEYSNVRQK